jgi:uncharacterized phage-associated protein
VSASVRAIDVAEYVLQKYGEMDTYKVQKLTYYCQAWSLAWEHGPLFSDKIEAWRRGPVIRSLFAKHAGQYHISSVGGNAQSIEEDARARATIDAVLRFYVPLSGARLSDLTHVEDPWVNARKGLGPKESCDAEITQDAMKRYYKSLASRAAAS